MNCEEAFELLTGGDCVDVGGGDVSGGDSACEASLAEHVSTCASCARLAEAMSPALELFRAARHQAAGYVEPALELPEIRGPWSTVAAGVPTARENVRTLSIEPALSQLMSLAAVLLVGLSLGGVYFAGHDNAASLVSGGSRMPAHLLGAAALGSLQVTPACLPIDGLRPQTAGSSRARPALDLLAQLDVGDLACCTLCHTAASAASDLRQATLQVARSCSVCHTN